LIHLISITYLSVKEYKKQRTHIIGNITNQSQQQARKTDIPRFPRFVASSEAL
jgi:hypothetical protein